MNFKIKQLAIIFFYTTVIMCSISLTSCAQRPVVKSKSTITKVKKPNILFIMLDDLGKEWIETYGAP